MKALRASPTGVLSSNALLLHLQSEGEFQQKVRIGLIYHSQSTPGAFSCDMGRARGWIHIHSPGGICEQFQKSLSPSINSDIQCWHNTMEITCYLYSRVSSHKAVVTTQNKFAHWHAGILLTLKCTREPLYIHVLALELSAAISQLAPPSLRHSGKNSGRGLSRGAWHKAVRPFTKQW